MLISPQSVQTYRVATPRSKSFYGDFSLGSKTHQAQFSPISQEIFAAYGLNLSFFRKGGWISIMPNDVYDRCAKEFQSEGSLALYPFNPSYDESDFGAILRGKKNCDSKEWRVIALPENFSATTLLHEILHDIFLGGALKAYDKEDFFSRVIVCLRKASKDKELNAFFEAIKERFHISYALPKSQSNQTILNDLEFQIFANECFAYAGENLFTNKIKVPQELSFFFHSLRLFVPNTRKAKILAPTSQPLAHALA
jgi:hypothetical protein